MHLGAARVCIHLLVLFKGKEVQISWVEDYSEIACSDKGQRIDNKFNWYSMGEESPLARDKAETPKTTKRRRQGRVTAGGMRGGAMETV